MNYTSQGTQGLLKEGGSSRRTKVIKVIEGLGGQAEAWYYALGEIDLFVTLDLPDAQTAAALSLVVHAAGGAQLATVPLLTLEEFDAACKKSVPYRAPETQKAKRGQQSLEDGRTPRRLAGRNRGPAAVRSRSYWNIRDTFIGEKDKRSDWRFGVPR